MGNETASMHMDPNLGFILRPINERTPFMGGSLCKAQVLLGEELAIRKLEGKPGSCITAPDLLKSLEHVVSSMDHSPEREDQQDLLNQTIEGYWSKVHFDVFSNYLEDPNTIFKTMDLCIKTSELDMVGHPDDHPFYSDVFFSSMKSVGVTTKDELKNYLLRVSTEVKKPGKQLQPTYESLSRYGRLLDAVIHMVGMERVRGDMSTLLVGQSEEHHKLNYQRLMNNLLNTGYCDTCSKKTVEYFSTKPY